MKRPNKSAFLSAPPNACTALIVIHGILSRAVGERTTMVAMLSLLTCRRVGNLNPCYNQRCWVAVHGMGTFTSACVILPQTISNIVTLHYYQQQLTRQQRGGNTNQSTHCRPPAAPQAGQRPARQSLESDAHEPSFRARRTGARMFSPTPPGGPGRSFRGLAHQRLPQQDVTQAPAIGVLMM